MSDKYAKIAISYEGHIIRVVEKHTVDGRIHESAHRPPGTRIIIHNLVNNQILLNQETRLDIGADLRLPGGKICETNSEWDLLKDSPDLNNLIIEGAARESREEAAIDPHDLRLLSVSTSGAPTIKFDLYYLVATKFTKLSQQQLTEDEIITNVWLPVKEVVKSCLSGKVQEGRSIAAILQYLYSINQLSL